jgi:hypothetical protein
MTILFYIEPVVFRRSPDLLTTWVEWVSRIVVANPGVTFGLASSDLLLSTLAAGDRLVRFPISVATVLQTSAFSRIAYGAGLFNAVPPVNPPLSAAFEAIDASFRPDTVISFTENPWLNAAFPGAVVLFIELGVWPRMGVPLTFFLDRLGHQNGILNQAWGAIDAARPPLSIERAADIWAAHVRKHTLDHPAYERARDWIAGLPPGRRRVLALQPPDWLTYEGLVGPVAPEELICAEAFAAPDAVLIPTYHTAHGLGEAMETYIVGEFPNVVFPPADLASGVTDLLTVLTDELITISSTSAISAILAGTPTRILGRAAFHRAAEAMNAVIGDLAETARLRRNLLAVLSNRLLHPLDRCLDERDYFARAVADLRSPDPVVAYLDFSGWREERLEALLALP